MKEYYDYEQDYNELRNKIVGLGESSIKKNYYPQLQQRILELEYSESKNKAILEALPDMLMLIDNKGTIIDYSRGRDLNLNDNTSLINTNIKDIKPSWIFEFFDKTIKNILEDKEVKEYEYKYDNDGMEKYCEIRAVTCGENEVLFILRDITEEKKFKQEILELNEVLRKSEYTFRTLFKGSSDTILLFRKNKIFDCNSAAMELFDYGSKEKFLGKIYWELSPKFQPNGKLSKDEAVRISRIVQKIGKYKFEWWMQKFDGTIFPVEIMLTSIMLNGKRVFHACCRDISDRKHMELRLEYLSYHDQLTGLYNRRFYEEELKRLDVLRNYPLTLVIADVNGLKLINDSFGHKKGDEIIKKVASAILKGCRADDIVARFGGDEYIIILPRTSILDTEGVIKRIKDIVSVEKVGSIDISVSFGWETKNHESENIDEIFKKAEDYMYKQKLFESPSMRGRTVSVIIKTLYEKNKREEAHSRRVSTLCYELGRALNLTEGEIEELKTVGLFHDIGKIAIEESILNKNGKLDFDEWEQIKRHPEIGYRILSTVNEMAEMAEYVLAHHEKWNGEGYPKGLKGKEIPLQSRIISIADAFDAMTSDRTYKIVLSFDEAIKEVKKNAGIQFDPNLVEIFINKVLLKKNKVLLKEKNVDTVF